jgi:flagellar basal-body rod protein FlgC
MIDPIDAAIKIAGSGLETQSARLRIVAENLANAQSTGSAPGADPYARKTVTFESELDQATGANLVRIKRVGIDRTPFRVEHDPGSPAADSNGFVKFPNVELLVEMADLREANRSYEANLQVIKQTNSLSSFSCQFFVWNIGGVASPANRATVSGCCRRRLRFRSSLRASRRSDQYSQNGRVDRDFRPARSDIGSTCRRVGDERGAFAANRDRDPRQNRVRVPDDQSNADVGQNRKKTDQLFLNMLYAFMVLVRYSLRPFASLSRSSFLVSPPSPGHLSAPR